LVQQIDKKQCNQRSKWYFYKNSIINYIILFKQRNRKV